jgi:diacylglycerol kinase family enzyme
MGSLAYFVAGLKAIANPEQAHYRMEFDDGRVVEDDGVTCLIAKVGNLGIPTLENSPETADPDAALMDIAIIRRVDLPTLVNLATTLTTGGINPDTLPHWQAHRVVVHADPPQAIQADGEVVGETPVSVQIIPQPVNVIVPEETLVRKGKGPA